MTVLQALDAYYERMLARGEAEAPGFSREKIGFAIVLSADGAPIAVNDLREQSGKKRVPKSMSVPTAVKRTVAILPNLFWDKTAYALGRTAGEGKRTAQEHAAFKAAHAPLLAGTNDPGLVALRRFLENWTPDRFDEEPFSPDMLDANVVFRLEGERGFIHERDAALTLLERQAPREAPRAVCLVTGREAAVTRLHPTIKGVEGAQSSGASLISFNLDAFTSYGKAQGANAPTSEAAAFRYGAALNGLLSRGGRNRLSRPLGDATVAFWADASAAGEEAGAAAAEELFGGLFDPPTDSEEAEKLRERLDAFSKGKPVVVHGAELDPGTRFHILGLAPNAARLSVRCWMTGAFGDFVRRMAEHRDDMAIEPAPWRSEPSVSRLLVNATALQQKFENIPPLLAGETMRAVLEGTRYPRTLLAAAIARLRAGDDPATGWHAAAIKAVLARDHRLERTDASKPDSKERAKRKPPVSLDKDNPNEAYQLGRLFAAVETAQRLALGRVNATIRDRYFGAASATPASVFPLLMRGAQNHLGKLRKSGKGFWLEREIEEIAGHLPPALPRSLKLEAQGRFVLGYYHQRKGQLATREAAEDMKASEDAPEGGEDDVD